MTMLAFQRHLEILNRVKEAGGVRVADLAQRLNVTEETIRRDLRKLGDEGKLVRIHGGAVFHEEDHEELPFDARKTAQLAQKRAIAAEAVKEVAEGDVIALDASSTACELARILPNIPLTVITNSEAVINALVKRLRLRIVSTGGVLDVPSLSYVGPHAEKALERFNINKAFLSCKGVDFTRGLSVADDIHARMKRGMVELSESVFLLADHTKFGVKSVEFFAGLDEIDVVVTDRAVNPGHVKVLKRLGRTVKTA